MGREIKGIYVRIYLLMCQTSKFVLYLMYYTKNITSKIEVHLDNYVKRDYLVFFIIFLLGYQKRSIIYRFQLVYYWNEIL